MIESTQHPRLADAWGDLLQDCCTAGLPAGRYFELTERDDGFLTAYDALFFFSEAEGWTPLERWAYDRAVGRVLDIGVGAGRFSLALQRDGVDVVGLDVSPGAIDVCRRRGLRSAVLGDVNDLGADERFDSFLLLGKNLALLESRQRGPEFLADLARIANPGARIVGTCVDPYLLDGDHHKAYLEANSDQGRMSGQMRLRMRHQQSATDWFDYLFLSPDELVEMADGTGWLVTDVHRDGSGYAAVIEFAG